MKKTIALLLAIIMLAALGACSGNDADIEQPEASENESLIALAFVFKNKTGKDIIEAYVYPVGSTDKGENVISETWENNTDKSQYKRMILARPEADYYEIAVSFTDGTGCVFSDLALKFNNSVSMKSSDGSEISVKNDNEVEFTKDELTAAGVTVDFAKVTIDESNTTQLKFLFKNKTSFDCAAVYVYPTGTEDMGESVIDTVYPSNKSQDDYLWLVLERPTADTYDITVEFTDGQVWNFKGNDLANANSVSMKDDEETLSVKYDSNIDENGQPIAAASDNAVDDNAETITLRFVFKNKTGLTMKAAYLYPVGAEDMGANLLSEDWPICESDDQYKHLVLTDMPNAELYELTVILDDGSAEGLKLVYTDLDMKSNNSMSLKDAEGFYSLKYDANVTFDS
ncbi:MAG TPA: hypothetical protein P5116_02500 [Eubacteriales bacterium]|nr:hypothetical protein [Eubacteriales bacterium]